jgi:hypothetical protein
MKEMKVRGYGWWTSYTDTHVQETFLTPKRHDQRRTSPHHIRIKVPRLESKESILKAPKENANLHTKDSPYKLGKPERK